MAAIGRGLLWQMAVAPPYVRGRAGVPCVSVACRSRFRPTGMQFRQRPWWRLACCTVPPCPVLVGCRDVRAPPTRPTLSFRRGSIASAACGSGVWARTFPTRIKARRSGARPPPPEPVASVSAALPSRPASSRGTRWHRRAGRKGKGLRRATSGMIRTATLLGTHPGARMIGCESRIQKPSGSIS